MKKKVHLSNLFWKKNQDYQTQVSLKQDGLANSLKAEDELYDYYLNEDYKKGEGEEGKWWCYYTGEESVNLGEVSENEVRHESREQALEWTEDIINEEVDLSLLKWEVYNVEQPNNLRSLNELNKSMKDFYDEETESKKIELITYKSLPLYAHYKNYVFILSQREKDSKWWGTYESTSYTIYPTPFFDSIQYPYFKTKLHDSREEALEELQKLINKKLIIEDEEEIEKKEAVDDYEEAVKENEEYDESNKTQPSSESIVSSFFSNKGYKKMFATPTNSAFTVGAIGFIAMIGQYGFDFGYILGGALGGAVMGLGYYYIRDYFKKN